MTSRQPHCHARCQFQKNQSDSKYEKVNKGILILLFETLLQSEKGFFDPEITTDKKLIFTEIK